MTGNDTAFTWELLAAHQVKSAPPCVYYIPNFISTQDEDYIIKHVYEAPKPKWVHLLNRRLQDYGGIPHQRGIIPDPIPAWLLFYMDRITELGVFGAKGAKALRANHCLVNEYRPGQGIMPHLDGPLFTPVITTITCGSHAVLEFYATAGSGKRQLSCKLLLERRSLVILKDAMYHEYLHGIDEVRNDRIDAGIANLSQTGAASSDVLERSTRISLTIRNVPLTVKSSLLKIKK